MVTRIDIATSLTQKLASCWFPVSHLPVLSALVAKSVLHSRDFLRAGAESTAGGFSVSEELLSDEAALLTTAGSFESFMVSGSIFHVTLSLKLCWSGIATVGVTIDVAPVLSNPTPQPSHASLHHTFFSHAFKFWQKSQGVLLPIAVALSLVPFIGPKQKPWFLLDLVRVPLPFGNVSRLFAPTIRHLLLCRNFMGLGHKGSCS